MRSLRRFSVGFDIDLAQHFTASPQSDRSSARYDNLMTQILYLVASAASKRRLSLSQRKFFSLNPGAANGFALLPSSPWSLSTSSACLMSGSILTCLLPLRIRPNRHHTVQQLSVAFTVVPKAKTVRFSHGVLARQGLVHPIDEIQPQQSRLRELSLGNLLPHFRTGAGLATPTL